MVQSHDYSLHVVVISLHCVCLHSQIHIFTAIIHMHCCIHMPVMQWAEPLGLTADLVMINNMVPCSPLSRFNVMKYRGLLTWFLQVGYQFAIIQIESLINNTIAPLLV